MSSSRAQPGSPRPGAYAALDALDEAAVRESNRVADSSEHEDEPASNQAIEWVCTGPITYDRTALDHDIANLRAALEGHDDVQAFMPVVASASAYWLRTGYETSKLLGKEAAKQGYGEYRAHLDFMDLAADQYSFGDHAYRRFTETIKDAVDPNGILSPGKQSIWPASMRGSRDG